MRGISLPAEKIPQKVEEKLVSRVIRKYRARVFQGYLALALVGFATLAIAARFIPYFSIDLAITRAIQQFNPPWFDFLMRTITDLGISPQFVILITFLVIFLLVAKLRWEGVSAIFSILGITIFGSAVKLIVHRARPTTDLVHVISQLKDFSFPSGHVMSYMAFFGFLWFLSYDLLGHSPARTILLIIFGALVILVGPSRIYSGEHWASDVLGAYFLGSLWLTITIYFYRWGKGKFKNGKAIPE